MILMAGHGVTGQNAVAETRGKPFDLVLDDLGHVGGGAVGDVAIDPGRLLACRGTSRIKQAVLSDQYIRPLWVLPLPDGFFPLGNFG